MSQIAPLTQNSTLVTDRKFPTVEFKRFLDQILARVGGILGGTYDQLPISSNVVLWDVDRNPVIVITLTQNITIPNPTSMVAGAPPYRLTLIQDGTGSRAVSWGPAFKFPSGVAPTLSTAPNAVDELWFASDGTNMKFSVFSKDLR